MIAEDRSRSSMLSRSRPCEGGDPYSVSHREHTAYGSGSVSAFTRVFDALWAGTTQSGATDSTSVDHALGRASDFSRRKSRPWVATSSCNPRSAFLCKFSGLRDFSVEKPALAPLTKSTIVELRRVQCRQSNSAATTAACRSGSRGSFMCCPLCATALKAERTMRRASMEYGPAGVDLASDRAK
jgi:hypothetical protein